MRTTPDIPALPAPGDLLDPAVREWFAATFEEPTRAQREAWPKIQSGRDVLVSAPTGSGKTLAAFLVAIDGLICRLREGAECPGIQVLYVSPLKALTEDIHANLKKPLEGIEQCLGEAAVSGLQVRVDKRTGDSTPSERARLSRNPPHILVTTPESLFLLLQSPRLHTALTHVQTIIVDEIHALARDRRGAHLMLSLARLDERIQASGGRRSKRIGLSATQRPLFAMAEFLAGDAERGSQVVCIDVPSERPLDLQIHVPLGEELSSVASTQWWDRLLDDIAAESQNYRSTILFVNTRKLAERTAYRLAERLGNEAVGVHHGSLSKAERQRSEQRLRDGQLRILVATASLELGIDVGHVDLVYQIASPRSLSGFVQRVGRSGHGVGRTRRGRLLPTSRDELMECAALVRAVKRGEVDKVAIPKGTLDVLAQQIVAACAEESRSEDSLYELFRSTVSFASLRREDFDAVVKMLSEGLETPRGIRGRLLHRNGLDGTVRGRRGARLITTTCGGTIAELGEYRVVLEPEELAIGTVHEDWAIESSPGDIFSLGSRSLAVRRVENGIVRVVDAAGAPPTFPFWIAEAPGRSDDLSAAVSSLRADLMADLQSGRDSVPWLVLECGLTVQVAEQLAHYARAQWEAVGVIPSREQILVERFFDEAGGQQLVVHAPFGARINRGLGLSLRKRFCRAFNQELQAAATDDAVVLSLGNPQTFPLAEFPSFLSENTIEEVLTQAFLASPLFPTRMRWNFGRSLMLMRFRGGKKVPFHVLRMEGDDLLAASFPDQAACQEHVEYPIAIPDHPIVRQSLLDCLTEVADAAGLKDLLIGIRKGDVAMVFRDTVEPSPFCHEILSARPFAFLDDAPLEERRTRAVVHRRTLPPSARDLGRLDPHALESVRSEARPHARDVEEFHEILLDLVLVPRQPVPLLEFLSEGFDLGKQLLESGRARLLRVFGVEHWVAYEHLSALSEALGGSGDEATAVDASLHNATLPDSLLDQLVRGYAALLGPFVTEDLAAALGLPLDGIASAALRLETRGILLRGTFDPELPDHQHCDRRLLARIHHRTLSGLRRLIEPVSSQDTVRFLLRWQHVHPEHQRAGEAGLAEVIRKMAGWHAPLTAWESQILPPRMMKYERRMLDHLCLGGEVTFGRLRAEAVGDHARAHRQTPLTIWPPDAPAWWVHREGDSDGARDMPPDAERVRDELRNRGALFRSQIARWTGLVPAAVDEALKVLFAFGCVTCDGFAPLRRLVTPSRRSPIHRGGPGGMPIADGRWSLLPAPPDLPLEDAAMALARQLLARYGVIFRDLLGREWLPMGWRAVRLALVRLEDRGEVRGGFIVAGMGGEHFALPGALERLREESRRPKTGEVFLLSPHDPLDLRGVIPGYGARGDSREGSLRLVDGLPATT